MSRAVTSVTTTSAAMFVVEPGLAQLLFKIGRAATIAAGILTTFKSCDNR